MRSRRLFAGIMRKPDNQALKGPNFHVVAVNEPERFVGGFMIVGALNDFRRPRNAVLTVDKIDAICGRGAAPCLRRERYPNSQSPTPDRRSLSAMCYIWAAQEQSRVSKDVEQRIRPPEALCSRQL